MVNSVWMCWQIDYLLCLQTFRDTSHHIFDKFFLFITMFGEVTIPIMIITLFYWVLNKRVGQFMLWSYILGFILNFIAKVSACIYRPWILDPRVKPLVDAIPAATGYSFPSGHTAGVMSIWGSMAVSFWNNNIIRYLCIIIIASVMLSRNYLGVHTPQDVVVSFIISCFVIWGVYKLMNWEEKGKNRDIILSVGVFILTILALIYAFAKCYPIHYLFGQILYDPTSSNISTLHRSGLVFGAFTGWLIEKRCINFEPQNGSVLKKIIRYSLGILLLFGLNSSTKLIGLSNIGIFVQHILVGFFITLIYPFFVKKYDL